MADEKVGHATIVKVDTAGGGSTQTILNQVDATLSLSRDTPESTNKSGTQWKTFEYGNAGATLTVNGMIDSGAGGDTTGLVECRNAIINKTKMDVEFVENHDTADITFSFQALVTSVDKSAPQNDIQTYTITFQSDGAVSVA